MKQKTTNGKAGRLLAAATGSAVRPCVSCGAPAVLKNEDGEYCKDCMQIHLIEKIFVNLTKPQRSQ